MNKITKNIAALIAFGIGTTTISFAQVTQQKIGNNPTMISPSAVIEVESTNKGALLPRVALTSLIDAVTISNPADALTVFNTATAGSAPNNVTPGYYYWKRDLVTPANSKWVRIIDQTSVTEPWQVQGGTAQATTNGQNIYQTGSVAVGDFSTAASTKKMEVKGDFKAEAAVAGGVAGIEIANPQNPNGAMHYWSNGTNYRIASANNLSSALTAITGATTNTFAATSTNSEMSSVNGGNSLSTVRAENTGNFFMESYNVSNNFSSTFSLQNDGLRLVHSNNGGTGINFLSQNNRSEILVQKATGVRFSFRDPDGLNPQAYWFPLNTGNTGQVMMQSGTGGKIVWTDPSVIAKEPWFNMATNVGATLNTDNIYQMGNVAIGATTAPSFTVGSGPTAQTIQPKLHVAGDISTTGKVWTTNSVYADYVFEKYFKGSSDINPNYEFKSLNYVKDFIKANHHLPGVESIDDLAKAENGYTFDITKLTVQSLEKIEELYLHTIEQQDKIEAQQAEIDALKKDAEETKKRLERLEKLLTGNK